MSSFLEDPVREGVVTQLEKRGEILSKKSGRTADDIKYISSRTGWVRVTSGVNTDRNEKDAKELVLQGGAAYFNSTSDSLFLQSGISFDKNDNNRNRTYNTTGKFGTRPMPGITSFSIQSKGTYGAIRETTIGFNVWSLEDLEKIEKLYFRIGYSCIVEWGHTVYVDNKGTVQLAGLTKGYNRFFDKIETAKIQEIINTHRKDTDYNYDGIIGLVKNFSWSFRKDGGYDCSLNIISIGELIESLNMNTGPTDLEPLPAASKESEATKARASYFHFLDYALTDQALADGTFIPFKDIKLDNAQESINKFNSKVKSDFPLGAIGREVVRGEEDSRQVSKVFYITLRTFFTILNECYLLKSDDTVDPKFNIESKNKFNTFKEHVSKNPLTCLLPGNLKVEKLDGIKDLISGENDELLNILVSIPLITETYERYAKEDVESFSVFNFTQSILSQIDGALGTIPEFDITFSEEKRLIEIIDRTTVTKKKTDFPTLDLVGLKTTVSDLKIESKVSSKLGSLIAIAAQSDPKNLVKNLGSLVEWNRGKTDRFREVKIITDETTATVNSTYEEDLSLLYEKFNRTPAEFIEKEWNDIGSSHRSFTIEKSNEVAKGSRKFPLAGVVPVEVSLTLDGIGGIRIADNVNFNQNFLLPGYDIFSFQVTGVDHNIGQDNKWTTTLKFLPKVYPS